MHGLNGEIKEIKEFQNGELITNTIYSKKNKLVKYVRFSEGTIKQSMNIRFLKGICIELIIDFDRKGNRECHHLKFKKNNNILKEKSFNYNYELTYSLENYYNHLSNKIKTIKKYSKSLFTIDYLYDDQNNLISKKKYDKNFKLLKTKIWVYDENQNNIEYKKYNGRGELLKYEKYKYNKDSNLIEVIRFRAPENNNYHRQNDYNKNIKIFKDILDLAETFKYDVDNNKIDLEIDMYYFEGLVINEYDNNKNLVNSEYYEFRSGFSENELTECHSEGRKFNDRNDIIFEYKAETHTDWDDYSEFTYEYNYDVKGNIVKKVSRREDKSIYLTEFFSYSKNGIIKKYESESDLLGKELKKYDKFGNIIYSKEMNRISIYKIKYYNRNFFNKILNFKH